MRYTCQQIGIGPALTPMIRVQMRDSNLNAVTGAFSYTGKYIAGKLLFMGQEVRTLTGHPERATPFDERVKPLPLRFDAPEELANSLEGVTTLFNTYWIRFPRGTVTFDTALENTKTLIRAAQQAGVQQIVHISITNASPNSTLAYFKAKALAEEIIRASGMAYTIIRPTLIFGAEDILINNIAWFLRRFPAFPVPGTGGYPVQPVHVEDVSAAAVGAAARCENNTLDCVGPEMYSYEQLIRLIAECVGRKTKMLRLPAGLTLLLSRLAGYVVRDVVLTRDEIDGLMAGLLVSHSPATGQVRLSDWLKENRGKLGTRYVSELDRHFR